MKQTDSGLSFIFEMNCVTLCHPPPHTHTCPTLNLQSEIYGQSISEMKSLLQSAGSGDGGRWDREEGEDPEPALRFPGEL